MDYESQIFFFIIQVIIHMRANSRVSVLKKVVVDILEQERNVETRTGNMHEKSNNSSYSYSII